VPKLWNETIDAHRHAVHEAILDAAWKLASEKGVLSVTMSHVAEQAGIGRATLYKYFPDVESILAAYHDRHVSAHLEHLGELRARGGDAGQRLEAVLRQYARICYHRGRQGTAELSALLHRDEHVLAAQSRLVDLFRELLAEAAKTGFLRDDIASEELANYCVHALSAAGDVSSESAVDRLVAVILNGLRSPGS
jgi:AcrR family transcriptional regulator